MNINKELETFFERISHNYEIIEEDLEIANAAMAKAIALIARGEAGGAANVLGDALSRTENTNLGG